MTDLCDATGSLADVDGDGVLNPAIVVWNSAEGGPALRRDLVDTLQSAYQNTVWGEVVVNVVSDPGGRFVSSSPSSRLHVDIGATVDFDIAVNGTLTTETDPAGDPLVIRVETTQGVLLEERTIYVK
jgi:hypothetical protein